MKTKKNLLDVGTFDQKHIISIGTLCVTRRPTSKMSEYIRPGKRSDYFLVHFLSFIRIF